MYQYCVVTKNRSKGPWRAGRVSVPALILIFCFIPLLGGVINALVNPNAPWHRVVPPVEGEVDLAWVAAQPQPVLFVDARSEEEFSRGHIDGAVSLPLDSLDSAIIDFLDRWQPGEPIVVYCGSPSCGLSTNLANLLRDQYGLDNVWVLRGGFDEWRRANQ